jgi:two-component system chemotaxis sensor kinase CheA
MSLDPNDEILQDFLVSSVEILEALDKQLVELEQRPDDKDLLNAIFRGFHTIKGGASFLAITPLVDLCHRGEDVFNLLRKGERAVTTQLMDVVLRVLDNVNGMFARLNAAEMPAPADPGLLQQLEQLARPAAEPPAAPAAPVAAPPTAKAGGADDITDAEFESLLDALATGKAPAAAAPATPPGGEEITDAEFEALLDQLHGGAPAPAPPAKTGGDDISDAEFEALLDQLHGKAQAPAPAAGAPAAATPPAAKPEAAAARPATPAPGAAARAGGEAASAGSVETTVRVDTQRLDDIMNMVGELVLVRNRLTNLQAGMSDERLTKAIADLNMVTSDLQNAVMKTRMQPIKKVYGKFPRVVRDLARSLNKEINLELRGEDTEVDKNLVEMLNDPLVHLVRNSCDHGVEAPDARVANGKPRTGTVLLAAEQAGDHILLTIADDGAGMDPEVLRRKVVEKGLMDADAAARLSDGECYNLIFLPGFSTKSQISDVSGRGVGMDVVRTKIGSLNGSIDIESEKGKGTRMLIRVPLTLAIMPALMVVVEKQIFALPLSSVAEILDMDLTETNVVDGQLVALVRGKTLPLFYLQRWLTREGRGSPLPRAGHVVVAHVGTQRVGLVVDQLIGQEEVVIKPLGSRLHGTPGLAGATITGDGRIALILDLPMMVRHYARRDYREVA